MAKTVVTMTSWKKRIDILAKQIYNFFTTQTVKPDIFYLWLAETEFPNKEKDLPEDLLLICNAFNVQIKWTKFNDYCFKRWFVFPDHYEDLVITIDDDICFPTKLIEEANKHKFETNITYNIFKDLTFEYDYSTKEVRNFNLKENPSIKIRFLGCSVICPKSFPLECIKEDYQNIRRNISKRDDQAWIKIFMIPNKTKISFLPFLYKDSKINSIADKNPTWGYFYQKVYGYRIENYQLHKILKVFPELLKCWINLFPNYPLTFFDEHYDKVIIK